MSKIFGRQKQYQYIFKKKIPPETLQESTEKENQGRFYSEKLLLGEGSMTEIIRKYPHAKIIMIGENHLDTLVRRYLCAEADGLYHQGIRAFAIEGSSEHQELLSRLGKETETSLYYDRHTNNILHLHPGSFHDRSYADAIYALSRRGMNVFAIDSPLNGSKSGISTEERESYMYKMTTNILDNNYGKIIILIGRWHTIHSPPQEEVPTLCTRLISQGIDVLSISTSSRELKNILDTHKFAQIESTLPHHTRDEIRIAIERSSLPLFRTRSISPQTQ